MGNPDPWELIMLVLLRELVTTSQRSSYPFPAIFLTDVYLNQAC